MPIRWPLTGPAAMEPLTKGGKMTQEEQEQQAAAIVKQVQEATQREAYRRRNLANATALLVEQLLAKDAADPPSG